MLNKKVNVCVKHGLGKFSKTQLHILIMWKLIPKKRKFGKLENPNSAITMSSRKYFVHLYIWFMYILDNMLNYSSVIDNSA